jgi:hypothetical protein
MVGVGDVAVQLLEFVALIHGAAHLRPKAEPLFTDTAFLGMLRIKLGNRLQAQHYLVRPETERDAVGASSRLQWHYGGGRRSLLCPLCGLIIIPLSSTRPESSPISIASRLPPSARYFSNARLICPPAIELMFRIAMAIPTSNSNTTPSGIFYSQPRDFAGVLFLIVFIDRFSDPSSRLRIVW